MPKRNLTFFSWNVNGIRACVGKGFLDCLSRFSPDLFCIQEIKATEFQLTAEILKPEGYVSDWFPAARPGYSGTAVYMKKKLPVKEIRHGMGHALSDAEGRTQAVFVGNIAVLNCYFPNSRHDHSRLGFKLEYNAALLAFAEDLRKQGYGVIVTGDFNVAHREIDLKNPKQNRENPGFLPEERDWMTSFLSAGYVDTFRHFHPDLPDQYTWWSYRKGVRERNIGWRVDYFCASDDLSIIEAAIHPDVRGSDHCPVSLVVG
jgi:exodeoxyribonuclease III